MLREVHSRRLLGALQQACPWARPDQARAVAYALVTAELNDRVMYRAALALYAF